MFEIIDRAGVAASPITPLLVGWMCLGLADFHAPPVSPVQIVE